MGRFHVGTGQIEPTIGAGYTTACVMQRPGRKKAKKEGEKGAWLIFYGCWSPEFVWSPAGAGHTDRFHRFWRPPVWDLGDSAMPEFAGKRRRKRLFERVTAGSKREMVGRRESAKTRFENWPKFPVDRSNDESAEPECLNKHGARIKSSMARFFTF